MNRPFHQHRSRAPLAFVAAAVIAVCLLLGGLVFVFWREWQTFAADYPRIADVLRYAVFLIPMVFVVGYGYIGMVVAWRRWASHRYIQAYHVERLTLAQRSQGLPVAVQSLSYHDSHKDLPLPPMLDQAPLQLTAPVVPPSLTDALTRGWSTPERWLIGISQDGQPLQVVLKHTGFIALSGVQGTGKTNEAALLAAQCAAHRGTLFIADPQRGDEQSLTNRIAGLNGLAAIAATPDEINAMIAKVDSIYQFRNTNPGIYPPLLLLVDEFLDMMIRKELTEAAMTTLIALSSTGRKKNMFAGLCAANWNMRALGGPGVAIRQNVTAALVFNSSIETAELLLPSSYAQQVLTLRPGQCMYFARGNEPQMAITPELTPFDLGQGRMMPPMPVAPASAPPVASGGTVAPTARVPAQPTAQLSSTIPDQILLLLDGRQGYMTASEIAPALGIDLQVARVVIGDMYKAGQLTRRECQGRTTRERYEYKRAINKRPSGPLVVSA